MEQRTIQTQESAERIDALLARSLPELTRSAAQRLLAQGAVTKDGAPVKKNYKTAPGDTFVVTLPDAAPSELVAQDLPLDVVYEDDDLIVVNKPRGMVVHPAPGHEDGTLVNALLAHCGDSLSGVGGERRPGIVHRIDKDTSGLLVAAKNDFYAFDAGSVDVYTSVLPTFPLRADRDFRIGENTNTDTKYSVQIDDGALATPSSSHVEYSQVWFESVLRNCAVNKSTLHIDKPGRLTLRIRVGDPGIVLQKIDLDFGGMKRSYLGPQSTLIE